MSTFKHYRLVAAAICVAGFLAQGNAVAAPVLGPGSMGGSDCSDTNSDSCLIFSVNNNTSVVLYVGIGSGDTYCYSPNTKGEKYTTVPIDGSSPYPFDVPDDEDCPDIDESSAYFDLSTKNEDGTYTIVCSYSLVTAFEKVAPGQTYYATYQAKPLAEDPTVCEEIIQVVGHPQ